MASAGVDDRLEAGYRELKRSSKDAVKMVEATVQLGGDITKESEEMQIEALKEAYEELKEMCMAKRISFPGSDPRRSRQRPICIVILKPLTKRGIYRRKTIGDKKKMRRTQEKFLQCKKGCLKC